VQIRVIIIYPLLAFDRKSFHLLFSGKATSGGTPGGFVAELKLRSTFSAEQNFPDEIIGLP